MSQNINPYQLLGLSSKSTIKDLKKAYYELSLLCHPDKGGNDDEMIVLHHSYKYISNQLQNCKTQKSYHSLEKEFEDFCQQQEKYTPKFSDIFDETNDFIHQFNKTFKQQYIQQQSNSNIDFTSPFQKGYSEFMDKSSFSQQTNHNPQYQPLSQSIIEQNTQNNFKQKLVIYKEPFSLPNTYGTHCHLDQSEINDFSHFSQNLNLSDYKIAFNSQEQNLETQLYNPNLLTKTYEQLLHERNLLDNSLENKSTNINNILHNFRNHKDFHIILIQKIIRGFLTRIKIHRTNYYNQHPHFIKPTILLQKNIRGYFSRNETKLMILNTDIKNTEILIQKLKNIKKLKYHFQNPNKPKIITENIKLSYSTP